VTTATLVRRQIRYALLIPKDRTEWQNQAACEPDPAWTQNRPPTVPVMHRLALICDSCPVRAECAGYALDYGLDNGVFAGVYVPAKLNEHNRRTLGFSAAQQKLARRAGRKLPLRGRPPTPATEGIL
jgi:hypothetical protein